MRGREKFLFDPVHVGGDTNKTLDKAEGLLRTLSMYAREAVERQAYPGRDKAFPIVPGPKNPAHSENDEGNGGILTSPSQNRRCIGTCNNESALRRMRPHRDCIKMGPRGRHADKPASCSVLLTYVRTPSHTRGMINTKVPSLRRTWSIHRF